MVNVIIPLYHSKNTLCDTLDSLVAQTKRMFLVTLVQDGDKENYEDIINKYTLRGLNISLIGDYSKNLGPGGARQLGFNATPDNIDYVMFLDSDDMLTPRAIEQLYAEAKKGDFDIVSSSFIREEKGSPGLIYHSKDAPVTWVLGKIYKTSYLRKNNIQFLSYLKLNEDAYFNLVAFNCTDKKAKLDEVMGIWRDNKESLTRKEKRLKFMRTGSNDFIEGQVRGLNTILQINGEVKPEIISNVLVNIYKTEQTMKHFGIKVEDNVYYLIPQLTDIFDLEKIYSKKSNVKYLLGQMISYDIVDDKVVFYKQSFDKWFRKTFGVKIDWRV